jgi:hypothetical protein
MTSPRGQYISLDDAKLQLSIDLGNTYWDPRIEDLIGAAIDWAENFTQRSLAELVELNSPSDSNPQPAPDPKDSPSWINPYPAALDVTDIVDGPGVQAWYGWEGWTQETWLAYWANNPMLKDQSQPLRRDVKAAILLYMESLFDRNTDNFELIETRCESMLFPYRVGMGV